MLVPEVLKGTLDDLTMENLEGFKWFLNLRVLEGCEPIPRAHLEEASRINIVTKMIERYGEDLAVKVTVEILKKLSLNNLAEKLKDNVVEKITATSTSTPAGTTSLGVAPPASTMMSAQAGSVIIAPVLSGSTTGSWNITVNES